MFSYTPRISHFFLPITCFVAGQLALPTSWRVFGIAMYALGALIAFVIGYAIVEEIKLHRVNTAEEVRDESDLRPHGDDEPVHMEVWETPTRTTYFDLPATRKQLEALAVELLNGERFTQRRWTGKRRPFSINQFNELRDVMLQRGVIQQVSDKDPRQGYALTLAGRAMMKRFLPSPTLTGLDAMQETG